MVQSTLFRDSASGFSFPKPPPPQYISKNVRACYAVYASWGAQDFAAPRLLSGSNFAMGRVRVRIDLGYVDELDRV